MDKYDTLIFDVQLNHWKQYVEELSEDDRSQDHEISDANVGPRITKYEVLGKLKPERNVQMKSQLEALKLLTENEIYVLSWPFNAIYDNGNIPSDMVEDYICHHSQKKLTQKDVMTTVLFV